MNVKLTDAIGKLTEPHPVKQDGEMDHKYLKYPAVYPEHRYHCQHHKEVLHQCYAIIKMKMMKKLKKTR